MINILLLLVAFLPDGFEPEPVPAVPHIEGPTVLSLGKKAKFRTVGVAETAKVVWSVPDSLDSDDGHEVTPSGLLIFPVDVGRYEIVAAVVDGEKLLVLRLVTELKGAQPPPTPVEPRVDPVPDTAPVAAGGLRVLIVEESGDRVTLPSAQQAVFGSAEIRAYLARKCLKGADGKTPEFRIYDQDSDLSGEPKVWQDVFKQPRTSLPWIYISNGRATEPRGATVPLPKNVAETMTLLKKYGGE